MKAVSRNPMSKTQYFFKRVFTTSKRQMKRSREEVHQQRAPAADENLVKTNMLKLAFTTH
jgi:hypothetical protein